MKKVGLVRKQLPKCLPVMDNGKKFMNLLILDIVLSTFIFPRFFMIVQ